MKFSNVYFGFSCVAPSGEGAGGESSPLKGAVRTSFRPEAGLTTSNRTSTSPSTTFSTAPQIREYMR